MTTYRAVMLTGRGEPDRLREVDLPLIEPGPGEVRLAVRATGAGGTDMIMRRGFYPYAPKFPFVPGYEVVGEASNGRESVELYRSVKPDLVTMDITMPDIDGITDYDNTAAWKKKTQI